MPRQSAGILLYRYAGSAGRGEGVLEVFLVHPGGPFWAKKDEGAWSIPKGEFGEGEAALDAARREFEEETGSALPEGEYIELKPVKQAGGKIVYAWALKGDIDPQTVHSNTFKKEWPPNSGRWHTYPEVDRAAWFPLEVARQKILKGQLPLLEELERRKA